VLLVLGSSFSGQQRRPFENYGAACNLYKQTAITYRYTIIVLDVKYQMISLRESGLFKLFGLIE
jgi:hypothetical protein